jgi:antitoxin (DNA-binding transcriptional repressor) of toxin-antitoxin stability system
MNINTDDLISVSEANHRGLSSIVNDAAEGHPKVILRSNKPVAAIVDIATMNKLQELDEREDDLRLLGIAIARAATDNGERHTLRDVAARFGIDLDSLEDED